MISPTFELTYVCIAFTCFDEETIRLALKHKHDRPLSLLGGECVVCAKHLSAYFVCLFICSASQPGMFMFSLSFCFLLYIDVANEATLYCVYTY